MSVRPSVRPCAKVMYTKTQERIKIIECGLFCLKGVYWQLKQPWNDNRIVALKCLHNLTNKLLQDQEKICEYDNEIRTLISSGIAVKVNSNKINKPVYYMPRKPVYREDKETSKLRIAFDASFSMRGHTFASCG